MKYRLINWLLFIVLITFAGNIVRIISNLSSEDNIMQDASDKLQKVTDENQNLNRKLAQVGTRDFVEQEARNKLNLGKDGEIMLILPSISPFITPTPILPDTTPNWQKWVKLFL